MRSADNGSCCLTFQQATLRKGCEIAARRGGGRPSGGGPSPCRQQPAIAAPRSAGPSQTREGRHSRRHSARREFVNSNSALSPGKPAFAPSCISQSKKFRGRNLAPSSYLGRPRPAVLEPSPPMRQE